MTIGEKIKYKSVRMNSGGRSSRRIFLEQGIEHLSWDCWEGGRVSIESIGSLKVILISGSASPYALFERKGISLRPKE